VGPNVVVSFDSTFPGNAGMGHETSPGPRSPADLQARVLAKPAESLLYVGGGTKSDTHVMNPKGFAPYSCVHHAASFPISRGEAGVVHVDFPGSENQVDPYSDVGEIEESPGLAPC
jgi:hypothetical protein